MLFIWFNFYQVKAFEFIKKETLSNKVSFLWVQQSDSLHQKEFLRIEKLFDEGDYENSITGALSLLKLDINSEIRFNTIFLIAEIYWKNNNHTKAINYYNKALVVLVNDKTIFLDSENLDFRDVRFSRTYLKLGNEYLRNNQIDSAKFYFNQTLKINSLEEKPLSYQASASTNLSGIYMQDSLYDKAKEYAIYAVKIHQKRNNKISEAAAKGSLASIFLAQNNYKEAKKTYKEALDLIKYDESDRALRVKEKLYYNLAYNLYKLKDREAYTYQELSYEIKDTLRDKEIRRIIEEFGFKYDFDAKKKDLQKLEEVKLLREKDKVNTIVVISVLRILNAAIDGKESERKEIAETLHDSVSALLSSANLHLQASRKQFEGKVPIEIDKTQKIINEASTKIRDLSHSLMSSVLLKFGLNFAIKDIAEKYSNSQLSIDTQMQGLRRYDQNFEIKTYNIIQEFINNILKHSKANNAFIKLKEIEGTLVLEISDDGIGFNKNTITAKEGVGINQIDARIQMMKGTFTIVTSKGNGTIINVSLPIQEKETVNLL